MIENNSPLKLKKDIDDNTTQIKTMSKYLKNVTKFRAFDVMWSPNEDCPYNHTIKSSSTKLNSALSVEQNQHMQHHSLEKQRFNQQQQVRKHDDPTEVDSNHSSSTDRDEFAQKQNPIIVNHNRPVMEKPSICEPKDEEFSSSNKTKSDLVR